jgi:hypothetical protein
MVSHHQDRPDDKRDILLLLVCRSIEHEVFPTQHDDDRDEVEVHEDEENCEEVVYSGDYHDDYEEIYDEEYDGIDIDNDDEHDPDGNNCIAEPASMPSTRTSWSAS